MRLLVAVAFRGHDMEMGSPGGLHTCSKDPASLCRAGALVRNPRRADSVVGTHAAGDDGQARHSSNLFSFAEKAQSTHPPGGLSGVLRPATVDQPGRRERKD